MRDKVSILHLDASVYVEYALGLLRDEDLDVSERVSSVVAVFSGAADGLVTESVLADVLDEAKMTQDALKLLQDEQQQSQEEAELKIIEKQMKDVQIRDKQLQEAKEAAIYEKQKVADRLKKMTREEIMSREHLINEYGFTVMSEFDELGNIVKIKGNEVATEDVGPVNTNRQRVQQAQNSMREKMKTEHDKKVKYEKELLAKDKARKDKTKKRTMKKEKQRGCG